VKKSKFSDAKAISILRETDTGAKVSDQYSRRGMSDAMFY
jgi:hypothetical protein